MKNLATIAFFYFLQENMGVCMSQLSTVMEELGRLKTFNSRLEMLEQDHPELRDQADQEHDGETGRGRARKGRVVVLPLFSAGSHGRLAWI